MNNLTIIQGDALAVLKTLAECSVQCCVTSPPYWGLRDYGVDGQLGLERTPEEYVSKMVAVFAEVRRVLREDGTLWLNIGDSYAAQGGDHSVYNSNQPNVGACRCHANGSGDKGIRLPAPGLKAKDLVGIPWRLAFALQADGWWLRQDIIWHKPNPMPESVTDRCTKAHEYIFLLTKSARYYFDAEAIKEPLAYPEETRRPLGSKGAWQMDGRDQGENGGGASYDSYPSTRNKRSVWTVPSAPYSEAHFATFPPDLIKPCIMAGTSARGCCPQCGAPWERIVERSGGSIGHSWHDHSVDMEQGQRVTDPTAKGSIARCKDGNGQEYRVETKGWEPGCECGFGTLQPCTVLDPFGGSGTTGMVALELGRKALLIELNSGYVKLAERRCDVTPGLALA